MSYTKGQYLLCRISDHGIFIVMAKEAVATMSKGSGQGNPRPSVCAFSTQPVSSFGISPDTQTNLLFTPDRAAKPSFPLVKKGQWDNGSERCGSRRLSIQPRHTTLSHGPATA